MRCPSLLHATVDEGGAIGRLVIDRPEKRNALSRGVLEGLTQAATWFDDQPEIKVVIVTGAGRSFSAGFDLTDPSWSFDPDGPAANTRVGRAMADAIGAMGALTIAAIRGHCVGGGVVLASACDLRVAADTTRFRIPEVELGIPLYSTGIPRLTREIGPSATKDLVLTGRTFDAEEARALGFANRVVPDTELDHAVDALAHELAAKPGVVIRTTKQQVDEAAPSVPDAVGGIDRDRAGCLAGCNQRSRSPRCRRRLPRLARLRLLTLQPVQGSQQIEFWPPDLRHHPHSAFWLDVATPARDQAILEGRRTADHDRTTRRVALARSSGATERSAGGDPLRRFRSGISRLWGWRCRAGGLTSRAETPDSASYPAWLALGGGRDCRRLAR